MRLALLASLLAVGCTEDPPSGPGVNSHVAFYDLPGSAPGQIDVLFVVDNTTAMSSYQAALATLAAGAEAQLATSEPDMRIAVTTSTDPAGTLRQPATSSDPYLAFGFDDHFARTTNFTGTFTEALAPLIDVGATSSATNQPLESAKAALDAHPTFARDGALLAIFTITPTDDASTGAVADYATAMKARKADPSKVAVVGHYDEPATRLDGFHDLFPNRANVSDIVDADINEGFAYITSYVRGVLGVPCLEEPADVDAATPGPQYECDLNAYYADGTTEAIRQCTDTSTGRCFKFVSDPTTCNEAGFMRFEVQGFASHYGPPIRGQCVVLGPE